MGVITYQQPREKLETKGVSALSNAELLQIIIGSGSATMPVAKIAKKVAKVLATSGSSVHPKELLTVQGMGKVKVGQIVALFELAARFPATSSRKSFSTATEYKELYEDLANTSKQSIVYATFDGADRLIARHQCILDKNISPAKQTRLIFADCITDAAVSVLIAVGCSEQSLEPSLSELAFIRDANKTSQLLAIPMKRFVLVSNEGENIVKESIA